MPALLLIAHGSRDPRHAATVAALVEEVRAQRAGIEVATAYLDHCAPRIPQVVGRLADAVAVPLLLNRAFHAKHDIPAALRAAGSEHTAVAPYLLAPGLLPDRIAAAAEEAGADVLAPVLGPSPEVAALLLQRHDEALRAAEAAAPALTA
ncbi:sirohydrochlorin chelatase [Kitasatospora sp. NPDC054769]